MLQEQEYAGCLVGMHYQVTENFVRVSTGAKLEFSKLTIYHYHYYVLLRRIINEVLYHHIVGMGQDIVFNVSQWS